MNEPKFQKRQLGDRPLILIDGLFRQDFVNLFDRFLQRLPCYLSDSSVIRVAEIGYVRGSEVKCAPFWKFSLD
jgi:hypothetical protein